HREAVLAELNASHVSIMISPEELAATDLPPEGKDHNRALQITVGCQGYHVPHVLIDNGSAVNICTLAAAKRIGVRDEDICFRSDTTRTVRGKNNHITIPAVETNMVDNNYTEESVNQVFYKALSREKLPSWFEHGNTKVAHYLRK
ncbi:hypothetical protein MKW92_018442, partial [Papaver armeniacum]